MGARGSTTAPVASTRPTDPIDVLWNARAATLPKSKRLVAVIKWESNGVLTFTGSISFDAFAELNPSAIPRIRDFHATGLANPCVDSSYIVAHIDLSDLVQFHTDAKKIDEELEGESGRPADRILVCVRGINTHMFHMRFDSLPI
jgi:hypothetical protein